MQQEIGVVSRFVQFVLNIVDLSASLCISKLTEQKISELELELKKTGLHTAHRYCNENNLNITELCDVERFQHFQFSMTEKMCIQQIADTVQEKGIKCFITDYGEGKTSEHQIISPKSTQNSSAALTERILGIYRR